jgi:hypothetical protein
MAQSQRDDWANALDAMSSQGASVPRAEPQINMTAAPSTPSIAEPAITSASTPIQPSRTGVPFHQSIEYKRTLIPILLTCGVLLPALSLLPAIAPESLMGGMPRSIIITGIVAGLVLLALAALNMAQVKHQLEKSPPRPGQRAR